MAGDALDTYRSMRDFDATPEPAGRVRKRNGFSFVIQKHAARRLHYDFRLELDGVLKSWAVTRGPSLDPAEKRLAVRTEDHPVSYGEFEGVIPSGYGAGTVMLWDRGRWEPVGDPHEGLRQGKLKFRLHGERLTGGFVLIRLADGGKRENWLLIKQRDDDADEEMDPIEEWTTSVASDRDMQTIERKGKRYRKRKSKGKLPAFVAPQLATLRDEAPTGDNWLHEIKYDGYRMQALIGGGDVRLMTRNGKDWTDRYAAIADALAELPVGTAIIDGELAAGGQDGRTSFGALQAARDAKGAGLAYWAFDLLLLDGDDLRKLPLTERKARLAELLEGGNGPLRYSDHVRGGGAEVHARACRMGLEGIISKKADAAYRSGRSRSWIKTKCTGNDEFVIGGYRRSDKPGRAFASLLVGEHVDGELVYRGRVGTGYDEQTLERLGRLLAQRERKTSPFAELPRSARDRVVWVRPDLVAQVAYMEKTRDGLLRHPSFLGLREDKPAQAVTMTTTDETTVIGVRLTSPDKVMFPDQGATKREIAEYYARNAERLLQYAGGRPLSLIRCPQGRAKNCFFQKHHNASVPEHLDAVDIAEKDGAIKPYLVINSAEGLVAAAQIGALELHVWGARADRVERPERVVFDLDPGPGVDFADVRGAACEVRDILDAAGLTSFALLTGGKGIHVIVPVERRRGWDDIKAFARGFAKKLAVADPQRYVAVASKAERRGRIYVDWLRNERGATAIAPYSPRARAGAPVAVPVSWDELDKLESAAHFTLANIDKRLRATDPWRDYAGVRQSITKAHIAAFTA